MKLKHIIFAVLIPLVIVLIFVVFNLPEVFARCPDTGCVHYDTTYYSDFERGSKEYWTAYCNATADYPKELNKYKCR